MKLSISLISLVFISMLGLHQPAKAEEVFFHLNKPLYVEGEDLLFKIYSPERINSNNVQQILISLYSPDGSITIGTPIINSFKNGTVDGKFKLPEIKYEGKYLLRAFFNDMVYTIAIPIYKKSLPDDFVYSELDQETLISETVSDKIEITPNKDGYVSREDVLLKISDRDPADFLIPLNYSVSVFKPISNESKTLIAGKEQSYPLKISGEINGVVNLTSDDQALPNSMIVTYFLNSGTFTASYSDAQGNISINLDAADKSDIMYMQAFSPTGERLGEVEFTSGGEMKIPFINEKPALNIPRNPEIENYIYQYIQIENLSEEETSSPTAQTKDYLHGVSFSDEIDPNKFNQLVSFRDAVREIIFYAKIKKKRSAEVILLKNKVDHIRYVSSPLYFINGIPFTDSKIIMDLNVKEIESINIINEPVFNMQFWQMGLFGVIAIDLKEGVENPISVSNSNFTSVEGSFETLDFEKKIPEKGPYFTNELFWSQILYTDGDDFIKLKYSDDYSPYLVDVVGVSNTGQVEFARKIINRR